MANKQLDYNQKDTAELEKILKDKEKELFEARVSFTQRKNKNAHLLGKIRREIARLKTALSAKKLNI